MMKMLPDMHTHAHNRGSGLFNDGVKKTYQNESIKLGTHCYHSVHRNLNQTKIRGHDKQQTYRKVEYMW